MEEQRGAAAANAAAAAPPAVTPQFATAALARAALPRHLVAAWERYGDAANARHVSAASKRCAVMATEALQRAHERRRAIHEQQRQQQRPAAAAAAAARERSASRARSRSRGRAAPPAAQQQQQQRPPLRPYALEPELRALTAVAVSAAGAALSLGERAQGGLEDGALVSVACALAGVLTTLSKAEAQGFLPPPRPAAAAAAAAAATSPSLPAAAADLAAAAAEADAALLRVSLAHVSDALMPRLRRLPPRRLQQALWSLSALAARPPSDAAAAAASPPAPSPLVIAPLDANPYDSALPALHPTAVATAARGASAAAAYARAGEWLRAFEAASAQQLRASAAAAAAAAGGPGEAADATRDRKGSGAIISLPSLAQILASLVRLGYCPADDWWRAFWEASRPALVAAAAAGSGGGGGAAPMGGDAPPLDPSVAQELLGGTSRTPASRASDLSRVVHAIARLGQRPPTPSEPAAAAAASAHLDPPPAPWTELFLDASCAWLPHSGAEDLTRTIWALGCLGARPHRAWLMLFFLVSRRVMQPPPATTGGGGGGGGGRAQAGDLALWLQALARLGYKPSPAWLGDYVAATYPYLAAAEAAGAIGGGGGGRQEEGRAPSDAPADGPPAASSGARGGRARSRRGAPSSPSSGAAAAAAPPIAPRAQQQQEAATMMAPADAANLAWAAAAMAWQPPWRYWLALLGALRSALPRLAPRDVANAAWAVGRLAGAPLAPVEGDGGDGEAVLVAAPGGSGGDEGAAVAGAAAAAAAGEQQQREEEAGGDEGGDAVAQQLPDGWLADFCRLSAPALASMSGRELALTAAALASLRALPGPAWLGALAEAAGARLAQQQQERQEQRGRARPQSGAEGLRPAECRALAGAMARLALRPAPPALLRLQGELLRAADEVEAAAA